MLKNLLAYKISELVRSPPHRLYQGGCWKSANNGNSLAAYPTSSTVLGGLRGGDIPMLPDRGRDYSDIVLLPDYDDPSNEITQINKIIVLRRTVTQSYLFLSTSYNNANCMIFIS